MTLQDKLNNMKGKRFFIGKQNKFVQLTDYTLAGSRVLIMTDSGGAFDLSNQEAGIFLDGLEDEESALRRLKIEASPMPQQGSQAVHLGQVLVEDPVFAKMMETLDRVGKDPEFIPQAKAQTELYKQMASYGRLQLETAKLTEQYGGTGRNTSPPLALVQSIK